MRTHLAVIAAAAALVAAAPTAAPAAPSTTVVVKRGLRRRGNAGATLPNDFVELANRGSAPVDVSGRSDQVSDRDPQVVRLQP